jgi:hypothetical protein
MKNLRKRQRMGVAKDATRDALKMRSGSRRSVDQPILGTTLLATQHRHISVYSLMCAYLIIRRQSHLECRCDPVET